MVVLRVFDDDLGQHGAGAILAGDGVEDLNVPAVAHHLRHLVQVDVAAVGAVVKASILVFLDDDGLRTHGLQPANQPLRGGA